MSWISHKTIAGQNTNVLKFVFSQKTAVAEGTLFSQESRTALCCSTQSGCPVGCRFCGVGDHFVRSLSANEIVEQVEIMLAHRRHDVARLERLDIMFMSMGEPLLNMKNVLAAIRRLHAGYEQARFIISTAAPRMNMQPLLAISTEITSLGLQFSVHESTDSARNRLIPFAHKLTLAEIAAAGLQWHQATKRKPYFAYCAHHNNTSSEDADRLLALFDPAIWQASVAVLCAPDESLQADSLNYQQLQLAQAFQGLLITRGFNARIFNPAGQDIAGGCGQLWSTQRWMAEAADVTRPSAGHGQPRFQAGSVFLPLETIGLSKVRSLQTSKT